MEILYIKDPVWNPDKREWILDIGIKDFVGYKNIKYVQRLRCETLLSAERMAQLVNQNIK